MSFLWLADKPLRTREEIAREVHQVSLARRLDELATVIALMTISVEVGANDKRGQRQWWCPWNAKDPSSRNYPHDSQSDDGRSVGYFQQQNGRAGEIIGGSDNWWGAMSSRMTLSKAADVFLDRLADDYGRAVNNPRLAGEFAQRVQGSAYPDRYAEKWGEAWDVLRRALGNAPAPQAGYGLPAGTRINYGAAGFPDWVHQLAAKFNLRASTYPGHQESHRNEAGFAPNHGRLNRGIDWAGPVADMQRFADYLMSIKGSLEQVIWQNPNNAGQRAGVAGGRDVTGTAYYANDYAGHRDHVHTRQSAPIPIPGGTPAPAPRTPWRGDPVWLADVLRAEGLECDIYPGAFNRGHGDFGEIWGVMAHHTGGNPPSNNPGNIAQHPQLGLASQLHLSRSGKYTLCGVGIAYHAGRGEYPGLPTNDANRLTIGIEAENNGTEGWSPAQYDAYVKGCAAILRRLGHDSSRLIGHKDWAGKSQGKWDPGGIDMNDMRRDVQARIGNHQGGEELTPEQDRMMREIHACLFNKTKSWSVFANPGEGTKWMLHEKIHSIDGMSHEQYVISRARTGDLDSVNRIVRVARGEGSVDSPELRAWATRLMATIPTDILEAWEAAQ